LLDMEWIAVRIEASKCTDCGHVVVPPRTVCPFCGPAAKEMIPTDLEPSGEIVTYTVLEMPPEGFEAPVVLGLVGLEGGASVLCMGYSKDKDSIQIGTKVEVFEDETRRLRFRPK